MISRGLRIGCTGEDGDEVSCIIEFVVVLNLLFEFGCSRKKKKLPKNHIVFKAAEWANIVPHRPIESGTLIPTDAVVFEWEPAKFANDVNPGVGPAAGTMVDPEYITNKGGTRQMLATVQFADDEDRETLARENLAVSDCKVGESFVKDGKQYKLIRLLDRGVVVRVTYVGTNHDTTTRTTRATSKASSKTTPTTTGKQLKRTPTKSKAGQVAKRKRAKPSITTTDPVRGKVKGGLHSPRRTGLRYNSSDSPAKSPSSRWRD